MKISKLSITIIIPILSSTLQSNVAFAASNFSSLSAEFWQWLQSIPVTENPMLDMTGEKCSIGQRGNTWFIAGSFTGGDAGTNNNPLTRHCSIPEGKKLFIPVVSYVNFNSPNVCGYDNTNQSVATLRQGAADYINGVTLKSLIFDGKNINDIKRVTSPVFEITLPENNVWNAPCTTANLGNVPAGIYSPAVVDGYYVEIAPLKKGIHTLQIRAENPSQNNSLNITYKFNVVPTLKK